MALEDLPTQLKPRAGSNLLLWFIVGFFVLFTAWAALTEIERTVRGMGKVMPSSQLQVVSNLEGGIVDEILVRTGQQVKRGDPLIRLDQTQSSADLGTGEATTGALAMKIARLQAEVQGRTPTYPAARDAAMAQQLQIEQALHASRMADLSARTQAGSARLNQAQRAVTEARSAWDARRALAEARRSEADVIRPLVDRGIEPRLSLIQAESAATSAEAEAAAAQASIARAQAAVAEAAAAMNAVRQDWRATAATELASAQAEQTARSEGLPALQARVDRSVVRAPMNGQVNRVLVTTRGGTVQPAQPLVEIVPGEDSLLIEAQMRPQDISFVRVGQKARVSVTAYDRAVYGALDGEVVSVSPDAVTNEQDGSTFYVVRVRTAANTLNDPAGRPRAITPGMVAEVDVLGDKRTILQYILNPITRVGRTAFRE